MRTTNAHNLPEFCYVVIEGADPGKRIGIVKRHIEGYYATDFDTETATLEIVNQVVDELNKRLRVTDAQALAMKCGSMFGWHVPAANPINHIHA